MCIYAKLEYYPAVKKNEIMPFTATWMDLGLIILSQTEKTDTMITYMWNRKYETNQHIYKTKMDSQMLCTSSPSHKVKKRQISYTNSYIWNLETWHR